MPRLCLCISLLFLLPSPHLWCAGLVQRCVVIQRDENGFGLTVSGDNPVFVQSVKEGERNGLNHSSRGGFNENQLSTYMTLRRKIQIALFGIWEVASCIGEEAKGSVKRGGVVAWCIHLKMRTEQEIL